MINTSNEITQRRLIYDETSSCHYLDILSWDIVAGAWEGLIVLHKEARYRVEHPVATEGSVCAQRYWVSLSREGHDLREEGTCY